MAVTGNGKPDTPVCSNTALQLLSTHTLLQITHHTVRSIFDKYATYHRDEGDALIARRAFQHFSSRHDRYSTTQHHCNQHQHALMLPHPCSVDVKERLRVLLMTVGVKERQVQSQVDAVIDIVGEGAAYVNEEQFMTWWRSVRDEENKANPLGTSVRGHIHLCRV